jgi:hypothetical protein
MAIKRFPSILTRGIVLEERERLNLMGAVQQADAKGEERTEIGGQPVTYMADRRARREREARMVH